MRAVRRAAEHIRGTFDRLDVLVHSAGGVFPQKRTQTTALLTGTLSMRLYFSALGRPFSRSPEQAAIDIVTLLTDEYPGGLYGRSLKRNEPYSNYSVRRKERRQWHPSS